MIKVNFEDGTLEVKGSMEDILKDISYAILGVYDSIKDVDSREIFRFEIEQIVSGELNIFDLSLRKKASLDDVLLDIIQKIKKEDC